VTKEDVMLSKSILEATDRELPFPAPCRAYVFTGDKHKMVALFTDKALTVEIGGVDEGGVKDQESSR